MYRNPSELSFASKIASSGYMSHSRRARQAVMRHLLVGHAREERASRSTNIWLTSMKGNRTELCTHPPSTCTDTFAVLCSALLFTAEFAMQVQDMPIGLPFVFHEGMTQNHTLPFLLLKMTRHSFPLACWTKEWLLSFLVASSASNSPWLFHLLCISIFLMKKWLQVCNCSFERTCNNTSAWFKLPVKLWAHILTLGQNSLQFRAWLWETIENLETKYPTWKARWWYCRHKKFLAKFKLTYNRNFMQKASAHSQPKQDLSFLNS